MRMKVLQVLQIAALAVLVWPVVAQAGVPYPVAGATRAVDLGPLSAQSGTKPISVTIALSLPKLNEAESLLKALHTPQDPQFHQFLTASQFVARFAPTDSDVAKVVASLAKYGLTAERTSATTLRVTGLPADLERTFAVSLHSYSVPAHGSAAAYSYHAPLSRPAVPAEISSAVAAVVGLDSRPSLHPYHEVAPSKLPTARLTVPPSTTGDAFGSLTVTDFANQYDVEPLYQRGVLGTGRTIGIITFASLTPSDAYAYWKAIGLSVNPNRIKTVDVDGGPGAPSDDSGSIETTLDVEQSGGVAPGAKVIVYQAPNTNQSFVDNFAVAIDANVADSLSVSWGEWEWLDNFENSPVTDPFTGRTVGVTQAVHELLVRAAIQGQTVYAAAGDGGAYEANHDLGCFGPYSSSQPASCSLTLSVGYPGTDTAITAAGGTTLPGTQNYCLNTACTPPYYSVVIEHESVWGWDYLDGLCATLGYTPVACGIFPTGTGGGVSFMFDVPFYQRGLAGTQRTQSGQVFQAGSDFTGDGTDLYFALPSKFSGRNVPDISFNADPDTGYEIYYTSNVYGFGIATGYGGTSFVAPQLNGVSALLGEYLHGRIGLLNYPLYDLAQDGRAYKGAAPAIHAVTEGDNWFYQGSRGYNPAAGLGTLDVSNFADALRRQF